jgi:hypothetical protein
MTFDNGREFFVNWNRTDFLFGSMQKLKKNYSSLVKNTKTDRSKKRQLFAGPLFHYDRHNSSSFDYIY